MGVEDNHFQIADLDANTTFYDWVVKENTEIIEKLNLMSIYGVGVSGGIEVTVGSTAATGTTSGQAVFSLSDTIPGVTVNGNLVVSGTIKIPDGTVASTLVTSVNGNTGAVTISAGATGAAGPVGPTGSVLDLDLVSENQLVNGSFSVWQRGPTFSSGVSGPNIFFADRWVRFTDDISNINSTNIERKTFTSGQTEVLGSPEYYACINMGFTGGFTSSDRIGIENIVEGVNTFANNKIFVDGYARFDGTTGSTLDFYLRKNVGTTVDQIQDLSTSVFVQGTTWMAFDLQETVSEATGISGDDYVSVGFRFSPEMDGMTLELANIRAFGVSGVTLTGSPHRQKIDPEDELLKCFRYYQRSYGRNVTTGSITMIDSSHPDFTPVRFTVTPEFDYYHDFEVKMRKAPDVVIYSPSSGIITDGFNKSSGLDVRLSTGTVGYDNQIRLHSTGSDTFSTQSTTSGIIFDINSGRVVFDEIFVHFVADSDYNI